MPVDNRVQYDSYYSNLDYDKRNSLAARYIQFLYAKLLENIDTGKIKKVVDVGCGDGSKTYNLLSLFPNARVTGVDFSAEGIRHAKKLYQDDRLSYACCDAQSVGIYLEGGAFIVSSYTLEHIENWLAVIESWRNARAPYVMLCVPSGRMWKYDRVEHYLHFKNGMLEGTFADLGYRVVQKFYWGFPFYHPITKIVLNLGMEKARAATGVKPAKFRQYIEDLMYVLYTRFTSRKIGGDLFALFYNPDFNLPGK